MITTTGLTFTQTGLRYLLMPTVFLPSMQVPHGLNVETC